MIQIIPHIEELDKYTENCLRKDKHESNQPLFKSVADVGFAMVDSLQIGSPNLFFSLKLLTTNFLDKVSLL